MNFDLTKKRVGLVVAAVVALIVILSSFFTVEQYERGIITTWGKVSYVAQPGLGFKMPIVQSVTKMRTDGLALRISQKNAKGDEEGVNTYTIDNQEVDVIATIQYRIDPNKVAFVYENFQNYRQRLTEMAIDRLKVEMGRVNITHVAEQRGKIRDEVEAIVKKDALVFGVSVTDFQLTNIEYTQSFRTAVSNAATAKAGIDQREYERQQAEKTALKKQVEALGEANAAREAAKGKADAIDFVAKAEARALQVKGEATAAAMRAQAEALARNPVLVEMKKAEQWNGALPVWIVPGGSSFMNVSPPGK